MVAMTQQHLDDLKDLINQYSMAGVVEALAHVADETAEHVKVNYHDREGEREWRKAAKALDKAASQITT